jgi:hypothetical protein
MAVERGRLKAPSRMTVSRGHLKALSPGAVESGRLEKPEIGATTGSDLPFNPRVCRVCAFWLARIPAGLAMARTQTRPEKMAQIEQPGPTQKDRLCSWSKPLCADAGLASVRPAYLSHLSAAAVRASSSPPRAIPASSKASPALGTCTIAYVNLPVMHHRSGALERLRGTLGRALTGRQPSSDRVGLSACLLCASAPRRGPLTRGS